MAFIHRYSELEYCAYVVQYHYSATQGVKTKIKKKDNIFQS